MPAGRPTDYNEDIANRLCTEIASSSKSLRTLCKGDDMPDISTIMRWIKKHEEFREQYARAKEAQADYLIEEMIDIADNGSNDFMTVVIGDLEYEKENKEVISRSRLRVDTRKWIASKLKPKKYGDKVELEQSGSVINYNTELTADEIAKLKNELDRKY